MTSALWGREGGWPKRDDSTDRLREWDSNKGGEGVQKSENYANVINGCPLIQLESKYKLMKSSPQKAVIGISLS